MALDTRTQPSHQEAGNRHDRRSAKHRDTEAPHQLPRFGRIGDGIRRSGLSRAALYILAAQHAGLFKKYGAATIVDLDKLDQIIASLPDAEIAHRKSEVA